MEKCSTEFVGDIQIGFGILKRCIFQRKIQEILKPKCYLQI